MKKNFLWLSALPFFVLGHSRIFELDVPFHARVGEDILRTGRVLTLDSWSRTGAGMAWFNHEWLGTVMTALVAGLGEPFGWLPTFRALLLFLLFVLLGRLVQVRQPSRETAWVSGLLLLPAVYCSHWFQIRPEIWAFLCFSILLLLWGAPAAGRSGALRRGAAVFGLLLAWVNFHGGTLPFGLAAVGWWLLVCKDSLPGRWRWAALVVLPGVWLASPIGWHAVREAVSTLGASGELLGNPDLEPLSWKYLSPRYAFFAAWIWLLLGGLAGLGFWEVRRQKVRRQGEAPWFLQLSRALPLALLYLAVSFIKARAMPYLVFLLLPASSVGFGFLWESFRARAPFALRMVLVSGLGALSFFVAWKHNQVSFQPLGFGLSETVFPLRSVQFLRHVRPDGPLYNSTNFGAYLTHELREMPILDATSGQAPGDRISADRREALKGGAAGFQAFVDRQGYNTALIEYLEPKPVPGGLLQVSDAYFPPGKWAVVFFDNASQVLARRIPRHEELIRNHEIRLLTRFSPGDGAARLQSDPAFSRLFRFETERCLRFDPQNFICLLSKAAFLRQEGRMDEVLELESRARSVQGRLSTIRF